MVLRCECEVGRNGLCSDANLKELISVDVEKRWSR